jgi:hypothetical protein
LGGPSLLGGAALGLATLAPVLGLLAAARAGRRGLHGPSAARLAFVVAAATWLLVLAASPEFHRVRVEIALACGAGAFAIVLLVLSPTPAGRARRAGGFLLFTLASTAVLGEVALRVAARLAPSPLTARSASGVEERLASHAYEPGEVHFGFPCNDRGFFDEPFLPVERRARPAVAVIGDSFSASTVPHPYHYTTVCERALGDVDLFNVGWGGIGPDEYLRLLEGDVLPLAPDGVVVSLFLGNDLSEVRPWNAIDRLLAAWFDRGNVLILEVPRRLRILARQRDGKAGPRAPGSDPSATLEEIVERFPWVADPALEPERTSEEEFLRAAASYARVFGSIPERSWRALARRVRELRDRSAGIPFGVVLIPDESMVEDALWERILSLPPGRSLDRDALRERLLALCAEEAIPCLDLLPALRAAPAGPDGSRHLYLRNDLHWNARGNRVAGEALVPFVRSLLAAGPHRSRPRRSAASKNWPPVSWWTRTARRFSPGRKARRKASPSSKAS